MGKIYSEEKVGTSGVPQLEAGGTLCDWLGVHIWFFLGSPKLEARTNSRPY